MQSQFLPLLVSELKKKPKTKPPAELKGQLTVLSSVAVEKSVSCLLHPRWALRCLTVHSHRYSASPWHSPDEDGCGRWAPLAQGGGSFGGHLTAACLPQGGHCNKPASPPPSKHNPIKGKPSPREQRQQHSIDKAHSSWGSSGVRRLVAWLPAPSLPTARQCPRVRGLSCNATGLKGPCQCVVSGLLSEDGNMWEKMLGPYRRPCCS